MLWLGAGLGAGVGRGVLWGTGHCSRKQGGALQQGWGSGEKGGAAAESGVWQGVGVAAAALGFSSPRCRRPPSLVCLSLAHEYERGL